MSERCEHDFDPTSGYCRNDGCAAVCQSMPPCRTHMGESCEPRPQCDICYPPTWTLTPPTLSLLPSACPARGHHEEITRIHDWIARVQESRRDAPYLAHPATDRARQRLAELRSTS